MVRLQLDDRKWGKIAAILAERRGPGRRGNDNRKFVEAVLWWRRTGVPWRDLPAEFGPWKTVFNRFDRWSKKGTWTRLFLKQARRFATRYEKTLRNYVAVVAIGCALLW